MSMQLANLYAHHHPYIINLDDLHQMDLARSDKTTMIDEICYKCFDSIFLRLLLFIFFAFYLLFIFFAFFSFSSPFFPFFSARAKSSKYPSSLCRLSVCLSYRLSCGFCAIADAVPRLLLNAARRRFLSSFISSERRSNDLRTVDDEYRDTAASRLRIRLIWSCTAVSFLLDNPDLLLTITYSYEWRLVSSLRFLNLHPLSLLFEAIS